MSNFVVEYQNKLTNWQWLPAPYTPETIASVVRNGMYFDDEYIVPDYSISRPFFTWTNFRIQCLKTFKKVHLYTQKHSNPTGLDSNGILLQSGDLISSYGHYNLYNDSERLYFYIRATNQDANYVMTQSIYDPQMATKAVMLPSSGGADFALPTRTDQIKSNPGFGWNPVSEPDGGGDPDAYNVTSASMDVDVARWIVAWDNTCVNMATAIADPLIPSQSKRSVADPYRMIAGMVENDQIWLSCDKNKYIYGKAVFSLESHRFINYELLKTLGWKAFGVEASAVHYGE